MDNKNETISMLATQLNDLIEKNGLSVEKQLSDISKKIIATDRNVLRKEIAKNEKELREKEKMNGKKEDK